ncbi:murein hydrolase activator EnvC family protein [Planococcus shenhongbingii]|uniref:murein hydrolase activator EnvC family protein n=1 Tax=Planococcus shenhongbingii TaxID=3058398 RepID=UPI003F6FC608
MNLLTKCTTAVIAAIMALSISIPEANADKLSDLESKKQQVEQKQNELNSGIQKKAGEISQNQSKLEEIAGKIFELDNKIQETQTKIDEVQAQIDQTKTEIEALQASITELQRKIDERTVLLQERARAIQLSGGSVDYIDVLLGANSFIDFIDRFSAVNTLIEADREIMREQAEDKKLLAEQKAQVEAKLAEQEVRKAELVNLKTSLDGQKKEQAQLEKELKAEQERLANEKAALEKEHQKQMNISAGLESQIAKEQARLAEVARQAELKRQREAAAARKAQAARSSSVSQASMARVGSSTFIKPAAGRYTSGFGGRNIGAGAENHLGLDIANPTGTTIVASASGYVSYAGYMGGYGNVVILTHSINGRTYSTVYGHMNRIGASVGQAVSQGQKIGEMGSTGRSTGPHLHFEVHIGSWNGARSNAVNPAPYIR